MRHVWVQMQGHGKVGAYQCCCSWWWLSVMVHCYLSLGHPLLLTVGCWLLGCECASVKVCQPEGVLLDVDTAPASTKNATSIKLLSVAEIAATAKPKVLNPWEKCKAWCRLKTLLLPLLQGALTEGVCRHDWLL